MSNNSDPDFSGKPAIIRFLAHLWILLYSIGYILVLLAIGILLLTHVDQFKDYLFAIFNRVEWRSFAILYFAIFFWAIVTWYACRLIYYIIPFETFRTQDKLFTLLLQWIPRVLGLVPFLFFTGIILSEQHQQKETYTWLLVILLCLALLYFLFVIFRMQLLTLFGTRQLKRTFYQSGEETKKQAFQRICDASDTKWAIRVFLVLFLLLLIIALLPVYFPFSRWMGPITILISGLCLFAVLFTVVFFFNDNKKKPVFIGLILYLLICSLISDNSSMRSLQPVEAIRTSIDQQLHQWYALNTATSDSQPMPLIIVAAEGGGIRSMCYTAKVLQQLEIQKPSFFKHVFAISGVSGGGVGAVFYTTLYRDSLHYTNFALGKALDSILNQDYLSDVTNGFMITDNLQQFLPYPFTYLSRTNKLEDAFSLGYQNATTYQTLEQPFSILWDHEKQQIPNLLINGVLAETGQKIIESNLILPSAFFHDVIDYHQLNRYDLPIKTAATFCSRFPAVTNGGLIFNNESVAIGHVTDGGYKENTGLESAISLLNTISSVITSNPTAFPQKIIPYILYIKNSDDGLNKKVEPTKAFHEVGVIADAFYNSYNRSNISFENMIAAMLPHYTNAGSSLQPAQYIKFELNRKGIGKNLPLGWYLSDLSRIYIEQEAKALNTNDSGTLQALYQHLN